MRRALLCFLFAIVSTSILGLPFSAIQAESPLMPVKTDHPRDTMRTFMTAMNDYRKGVETGDRELIGRIDRAVRTLNLEDIPFFLREEKGREAAILLKETIDRVIVIDYDLIPGELEEGQQRLERWRLRNTEIVINRVETGERAGEYLFSRDTVHRASTFYDMVSDLPYLEGSGQGALYQEPFLEEFIPEWGRDHLIGLQIWQWLGLLIAIFLGLTLRQVSRMFLAIMLKLAQKSSHQWDNEIVKALQGPFGLILACVLWFFSLKILQIQGDPLAFLNMGIKVLLSIAIVWMIYNLANVLDSFLRHWSQKNADDVDEHIVGLVSRTLKIFIVIFGTLATIQALGINVVSLLAGLGIGGLAIALAARDTVANFFGSLMIFFDKPFKKGDWIKIGSAEGTVEEVGFRSTRIRTFYNSLISIPNSELMNAHVDNMGRRQYRRLLTTLGITYDTPPEKIEAFLEGIKQIVKANPYTVPFNCQIYFHDYGPDSLNIMVYIFFDVPDWGTELLARQNVLLEILRLAKELEVEFAFPTQTLHVESMPGQPAPDRHNLDRNAMVERAHQFGKSGGKSMPEGQGIYTPRFRDPD